MTQAENVLVLGACSCARGLLSGSTQDGDVATGRWIPGWTGTGDAALKST